ncbi:MAG: homoserine dehydrogenase [Bacillota bacterium]
MERPVCKVALLGFGVVGSGTYQVLKNQAEELPLKIGRRVEVARVLVRDQAKYAKDFSEVNFATSFEEIISDDSIDIVVELMGGIEPAKTYISEALKKGKHVVTANKDLIAVHGQELLALAKENNCDLLFEAAVGGAIPIIRPMKQCLVGNTFSEVMGIINGTTNFILTKMSEDGMEFADALKLAQDLGFAEADPTADVEGLDAGRKLAILASLAFHSSVVFSDVYTEGISKITARDIEYAHELNYEIKLLGIAKETEGGIEAHVHPTMIPKSHPLAMVKDSFNAVFVHGDAVDDAMFYGRGAGSLPTGSAVVGDILDVVRNMMFDATARIGSSCYKEIPVKSMADTESSYYIRMQVEDKAGTLAALSGEFGKNNVNISMLIQKNKSDDLSGAEIVIITYDVAEKHFMNSLEEIKKMNGIHEISSVIRVCQK